MKPVISLTWLSLLLLILSAIQAQSTITTKESSVRSENGSISTSNPLSTNTNSSMMTQKPTKIQEASNTTPEIVLVSNSTTTEAMKPSEAKTTNKHTTQKAAHPNSPTSQAVPPSATKKAPDTLHRGVNVSTVVKVLVILAVCILLVVFIGRWMTLQKNIRDAMRRCSHGLLERLRPVVAAMERCLGLSLWPCMENEGEDEEMAELNGEAGAKKVQEEEEEREEGEVSSDDYSSLGGMDLRDRARQSQEDVEWDSEKKAESKMEGAEEELTSVILGDGSKKGVEDNDLTVL